MISADNARSWMANLAAIVQTFMSVFLVLVLIGAFWTVKSEGLRVLIIALALAGSEIKGLLANTYLFRLTVEALRFKARGAELELDTSASPPER